MSSPLLSVILITRNERRHIVDCLRSVGFADEWIVVDQASDDGTAELAARAGAQVSISADWPGFGAQKNRALALATGRWVLSIDADERVTPALAAAIRRETATEDIGCDAYTLDRLSSFCGRSMHHGDWYPDRVLRLFRRGTARFSDDKVHERLLVDGRVGRLDGHLLHESMPDLHVALDKLNRYSTGRAADQADAGRRGGLAAGLGHGLWAFLRGYVFKRGFLDGRLGLVLAIYNAEATYYRHLKIATLRPQDDLL